MGNKRLTIRIINELIRIIHQGIYPALHLAKNKLNLAILSSPRGCREIDIQKNFKAQ